MAVPLFPDDTPSWAEGSTEVWSSDHDDHDSHGILAGSLSYGGSVYWPVDGGQGAVISVIGDPRDGGHREHAGIDLSGPQGANIYAPISGTVIRVGWGGDMGGWRVTIRDAQGNEHYLAHMDPTSQGLWSSSGITVGASVSAGQVIGYIGTSGNAQGTTPHVHYGINEGGSNTYDPLSFLTMNGATVGVASNHYGTYTGDGSMSAVGSTTPVTPPPGYEAYVVDGQTWLVYTLDPGAGATAQMTLKHNGTVEGATTLTGAAWQEKLATEAIFDFGTDTGVFAGLPPGYDFQQALDMVLWETGLIGTEALADQSVVEVLAQWMARPDMSPEEFSNRLESTDWWNSITQAEAQWNDLSDADRELALQNQLAIIQGLYWTYAGVNWDPESADGAVLQWAEDLAAGRTNQAIFVNEFLKPLAEEDPESPWSRTLRDEEAARGEHTSQVENTAYQVQDDFHEWGIPISWEAAMEWAEKIVMNTASAADYMNALEQQARSLYPGLPEGVSTAQWAAPYLSTYASLLEKGQPDLFNTQVQQALTSGMNLHEFSQVVRATPEWQETENANHSYNQTVAGIGRMFGFE